MALKSEGESFAKPVEKVGVIVVHGIGEQSRFEHLEAETRKVVDAIIATYGQRRRDVTPTLTTGSADAFQGDQSSWVSGARAPLHALVNLHDRIVDVAFHEVWWADINETLTLGKQIRFWLWGLSLPGTPSHNRVTVLPGAAHTRPPRNAGTLTYWHRVRMGYVSILFGLSAFSIALVNALLKRLDFSPVFSTDVLVNYLSGVKLYSQEKRAGGSPMDGPDEPPRAAIRRRMVRAMIDVARAGYDRWYILAHSLGSVVAWNGLMEIAEALPNYLDQECWNSLAGSPLRGMSPVPFPVNVMMPNRPVWLGRREIINRDVLFANFRGIVTYGAPLERFCALWSDMAPLNRHEDPFRAGVEWVNVYDPTDPVGTWISDFDPTGTPRPGHASLTPANFPCRASPILLLSHICYLKAPRAGAPDRRYFLVNAVAQWLVQGGSLTDYLTAAPKTATTFWMPLAAGGTGATWRARVRALWRIVQWIIIGVVLTWLAVLSLDNIVWPLVKMLYGLAGRIFFVGSLI